MFSAVNETQQDYLMLVQAQRTANEIAVVGASVSSAQAFVAKPVFYTAIARPGIVGYRLQGGTADYDFGARTKSQDSSSLWSRDFSAANTVLRFSDHFAHENQFPKHLQAQLNELKSYRSLKDGWDGVESIAPAANTIDNAIAFLAMLPFNAVPPETTASADGTTGLFWDTAKGYIGINFFPNGQFSYFARIEGKPTLRGGREFERGKMPDGLTDSILNA